MLKSLSCACAVYRQGARLRFFARSIVETAIATKRHKKAQKSNQLGSVNMRRIACFPLRYLLTFSVYELI
jgi:hypothetical protein